MNIGEAAETYAWIKLSLDGVITGAQSDLTPWPAKTWKVCSVGRLTSGKLAELTVSGDHAQIAIGSGSVNTVSTNGIREIATWLQSRLVGGKWTTADTSKLNSDMTAVFKGAVKGGSRGKADILPVVEEPIQSFTRVVRRGLSVKSSAGADPSLVNASKQTRFRFSVQNAHQGAAASTPSQLLHALGHASVGFEGVRSESYEHNLAIVDSHLAEMLAWMLVESFSTRTTSVSDLCQRLTTANPLNLRSTPNYRRKIGEFLVASALGMVPATKWTGAYEADGGMLVVKQAGELVTFFVIDAELKDSMSAYLLNTCYLDTASTKRHGFGSIYSEGPDDFLDLALQVRLKMPKKEAKRKKKA
jgi:hypothetical protein